MLSARSQTSARPTCQSRRAARTPRGSAAPRSSASSASPPTNARTGRVAASWTGGEQGPVGGEPGGKEIGEEALGVTGAHGLGNVTEQPIAQQRTVAGWVELQLGRLGKHRLQQRKVEQKGVAAVDPLVA